MADEDKGAALTLLALKSVFDKAEALRERVPSPRLSEGGGESKPAFTSSLLNDGWKVLIPFLRLQNARPRSAV